MHRRVAEASSVHMCVGRAKKFGAEAFESAGFYGVPSVLVGQRGLGQGGSNIRVNDWACKVNSVANQGCLWGRGALGRAEALMGKYPGE